MVQAPPLPVRTKLPPRAPAPTPQAQPTRLKTFSVKTWDGAGEGEKIIGYGASGIGKTTLFSMMPKPVYIGLDDGGRKIRNPLTGEPVLNVPGVETFQDVRDALAQPGLFAEAKSIVIDTATALELLAMEWVIQNVKHEKGAKVERIEDFGYGKGYQHMFDTMRLIFQDLDRLVRQGKNVALLCQQCPVVVANAAGANFLENGPKLWAPGPESKQSFATRGYAIEWADHVLRIGYQSQQVVNSRVDREGKEHAGKVTGNTTRVVYTAPSDPSFCAKSRTLKEAVISFETEKDDSLWKFMFPGEYNEG